MPLTGTPPNYTRGYDYEQHSIDQPSVPQPGDKLNQDFDDIATAINDGNTAIQGITNPDGSLKDGIVGEAQLAPGFYDQLVDDATTDLQPMVDDATAASQSATAQASAAQASALAADQSSQDAAGAVTTANDVFIQARAYAGLAGDKATQAATSASAAANSASTAQDAMVGAQDWQEQSFKWAEYLAGPVAPAPPGWPEAIDDGLWSAKWWALQAREIVGAWGSLYLGAFPAPPAPDGTQAWPPGSLYFDTHYDQMMVWDGTHWKPISAPAAASQGNYTYMAVEDQQDFSGPDLAAKTPAFDPDFPEPYDVHVNGVRLVSDDLAGGAGQGDYAVNTASASLHINAPLAAGAMVQWDLFIPPAKLAPGAVTSYKLLNMDLDPDTNLPGQFDGTRRTFPIRYTDPTTGSPTSATPGDGVQLQVNLDGVPQESGVDFTTNASDLTYAEAPQPGTRFWGVWFKPGATGAGLTQGAPTILSAEYTFNDTLGIPPNDGEIRFNNASQSAASLMFVSAETRPGVDVLHVLRLARAGDAVYLQDQDNADRWQLYDVSAVLAHSDWHEFQVTWRNGGAALPDNQRLLCYIKREAS